MYPVDLYGAMYTIQERQAEIDLAIQRGFELQQEMEIVSKREQQESGRRGWQHRWFGSKRLYTSVK